MTRETFYKEKKEVEELINNRKKNLLQTTNEYKSLEKVLEILHKYQFENRFKMKGILTRAIIDSLELDYSIGGQIISFDEKIK